MTTQTSSGMGALIWRLTKEKDEYYKRQLNINPRPALHSNDLDQVYAAFCQAQSEFKPLIKDKTAHKYKYADLNQLIEMSLPILTANGLSMYQYNSSATWLHTRIAHLSGQWFESQWDIPLPDRDKLADNKANYMQIVGSAYTYARRYQALAILGIHPADADNDAQNFR